MLPEKEGIFWVKVSRQPLIEQDNHDFDTYEWHLIYFDPETMIGDEHEPLDCEEFVIVLTTDNIFDPEDIVEIGPEIICPEPKLAPRPHGN